MYIRGDLQLSGRSRFPMLGALGDKHQAAKDFPDPNDCWKPGSKGKPDLSKIILKVEAELQIPANCGDPIITRTTLRGTGQSAATPADYASVDTIRFGVSDGTTTGGLEKPTKFDQQTGIVEFEKTIPWSGGSCTARDLFVYLKYYLCPSSNPACPETYTFVEVAYYLRIKSTAGVITDSSPPPAIRLNPCDNLVPIRSPYPAAMKSSYLALPATQRQQINKKADEAFAKETGISRKLKMNDPNDRRLAEQWWRIKDEVMAAP
jgi:hypothetical protein